MSPRNWCQLIPRSLLFALLLVGANARASTCKVLDYRIASAETIDIRCELPPDLIAPPSVKVYTLDTAGQRQASIDGTVSSTSGRDWFEVTLTKELSADTQYQLVDSSGAASPLFAPYNFDTKAGGKITFVQRSDCAHGNLLRLQSNIALNSSSLGAATYNVVDGRTGTVPLGQPRGSNGDHLLIGRAENCLSITSDAGQVKDIKLAGVANIFNKPMTASGTFTAPKAPAGKSSATYYAKFDAQAGSGQKPGYTLESTVAPKLANLGHNIYFTLNGDADLGFVSADTSKVTDMIKVGGGITHYFYKAATEFEPGFQYETDRHGQHRNFLFDGNAQFFPKGWRRTIAEKNYEDYAKLVLSGKGAQIKPSEVNNHHWGWQAEAFLGTEIGATLTNDSVKSSDKKTSVVLPAYDIARIRPKADGTLQYRRVSVTATATPRYLIPNENITREYPIPASGNSSLTIQQIYVRPIDGWRVLGSTIFLWNLDPGGHFSWSVTYKVGSEPPNFNHVNQVETGLVIIY